MNTVQAASFSVIFSRTIQVTRALWKPIMLGALLWLAMLVVVFVAAIQGIAFSGPITQDPEALLTNGPTPADISIMVIAFSFIVFIIFIGWASTAYQQVLAVDRKPRVRDTLKRVPVLMLPLAYVSLWIFVRSYVWMPMIALLVALLILPRDATFTVVLLVAGMVSMIACAIALVPRLMFAPVILISEKVTPLESVKLSEKYTKGRWGKVVGNWILLMFLVAVLSFGMQSVFGGFTENVSMLMFGNAELSVKIAAGIGTALFAVAYSLVYALVNFVPFAFIAELADALKVAHHG